MGKLRGFAIPVATTRIPMPKVLLINGPNLNLLGTREPERYGSATLTQIEGDCRQRALELGLELACFQSNGEGELIDRIHQAGRENVDFIVINPGAYTHTSIALRDSLLAVGIPFVETHMSNIHAREPFRHRSYLSDVAHGVIIGLGAFGYRLALDAAAQAISRPGPIEV